MGSTVKRQAQFPEQARHLLHELADPAAALRAILGNRGCRAAQAQPRGLQRGPRNDGFLQAYMHKSLISAAILLPRQRGEGTPRALVCDVYAVGSLWDQLFTALRISLAHVACTPSRLHHCQGYSYPAAVNCGQLAGKVHTRQRESQMSFSATFQCRCVRTLHDDVEELTDTELSD